MKAQQRFRELNEGIAFCMAEGEFDSCGCASHSHLKSIILVCDQDGHDP